MINTAILQKGDIKLIPFEDRDDFKYLYRLGFEEKGNKLTLDEIKNLIDTYGVLFWSVFIKDKKSGVVFFYKVKEKYILEALKDNSLGVTGLLNSIKVGKIVLEYFSTIAKEVYTVARVEDRAIIRLCEALKFENQGIMDTLYGKMHLFRRLICQ